MEACDSFIPEPERDIDKPFLMPVEDVFSITGRGTVGTGRVESGIPDSTLPVPTVPLPVIEKTSSTGIKKGLSISRSGSGIKLSHASMSSVIQAVEASSLTLLSAFKADPL